MFNDEFKERYTTIPFAIYQARGIKYGKEIITHYHREIELIAIIEGAAEFYINSQCYHLNKGDVLIIPPYALHRGDTIKDTLTSYDCICFDQQLLCDEELKKKMELQEISAISLSENDLSSTKQIHSYITSATIVCSEKETGWELEAIGNMSLLFGALKKYQIMQKGFGGNKETAFGEQVMEYLQKNLSSSISSRDVANKLYMNHSYFCRVFKKTFGCTFEKYVLIYRLEKSRLYLTNTTLPITEIAFCLGFRNCSYFSQTFKERYHMTPLSYRKSKSG